MDLTGKTHALPKEVFFSLKMVCVICQDQTAVLTYFTCVSNFMGLHTHTLLQDWLFTEQMLWKQTVSHSLLSLRKAILP